MSITAIAGALASEADLRIAGSDLLGIEFSRTLYDFAGRNGVQLALAFDGSRPGVESLRTGRADLALIVLPVEEQDALAAFQRVPLGYHRVVVLGPVGCALAQITLEQLAAVFGAGGGSAVMRWGDLGAEGEWTTSAITAVAPDVGVGIEIELFRHVVLRGRELKPGVQRYRSAAELASYFGSESRMLALGPAAPANLAGAKVIPVVTAPRQPAVLPTPENLHAGRYPLRLPLQVVYPRDKVAALVPLLRFLLGDDAAVALERAGLAALPAGARAEQLRALDRN